MEHHTFLKVNSLSMGPLQRLILDPVITVVSPPPPGTEPPIPTKGKGKGPRSGRVEGWIGESQGAMVSTPRGIRVP